MQNFQKSVALPDNDLQEKENKLNLQTSKLSSVVIEQKPIQNDHPTTYSWNKDSYNSNSEVSACGKSTCYVSEDHWKK